MAKVDIIQTSFAAGEFGPELYGRTDIAQYQNAVQIAENMIPRPYGSAISAPGSVYVATTSDSTLKSRLLKFIFNRNDAYVIEAGDRYFRFFTNRGAILASSNSATEDLSGISDLISQWKCNDNTNSTTVIDSQGSHSGTLSTLTSSVSTTGIINQAFNLASQYHFTVADHINFTRTASSQPMSIMAWVYYDGVGSIQTIASKWDTANGREYIFYVSSAQTIVFSIYDETNSVQNSWISDSVLTTGWHLIVLTFSGPGTASTECALYVDNIVKSTTFVPNGSFQKMQDRTTPFCVGAFNPTTGGTSRWNDKIDNVAFFHKILTQADRSALYTASVYQLSNIYTESQILDIQYAQLNDVIWLAHPDQPPQQLTRTSANEWAIANFAFVGGPFLDDNLDTAITITPSATTGTVNITVSPTTAGLFTLSGSTLGHHNSYWMIGGLAQTNVTTGLQESGYVRITHVINSYTATATVIKNLKASTATSNWAEGAWSAVRGYPARVGLHENRLWFARTAYEPQKVWGSKTFEYENFALDEQNADDGLNLALTSNESNEIQWLASSKSMIPATYGGVFIVNSGSAEPIAPDNVKAGEEIGVGSEDIQPSKIGNFIYYIQRFGKKLREMFYFWDLDTYKSIDRTILAPHILGDGVIEMDYQQNPDTILYCVRTEGTLALLTREADQEVTAWSRRTTAGTYTSIAIIPGQSSEYDEAWTIVERWVNGVKKKYVEYFENIKPPSRQDLCIYLDSALTYNSYNISSQSSTTISLSASSGTVTLTSSTAYFVGAQINKRLRTIDINGNTIGEGVITGTNSTTSISLSITTTFNALSYTAGYWGVSISSVSGLTHLEARTVGILADGRQESLTRTVASGSVTLGSNYFVVHVGLSYNGILYTLPKEAGSQRGTSQGKLQRYSEIAFKVNRSTQDFYYGPDSSNLDLVSQVITPSVTTLYTGVIGNLPFRGGYIRGAQIYIKNTSPLPIEILNIIGTLETYDK